jgi:hypothetical protein
MPCTARAIAPTPRCYTQEVLEKTRAQWTSAPPLTGKTLELLLSLHRSTGQTVDDLQQPGRFLFRNNRFRLHRSTKLRFSRSHREAAGYFIIDFQPGRPLAMLSAATLIVAAQWKPGRPPRAGLPRDFIWATVLDPFFDCDVLRAVSAQGSLTSVADLQ